MLKLYENIQLERNISPHIASILPASPKGGLRTKLAQLESQKGAMTIAMLCLHTSQHVITVTTTFFFELQC